MLGVHVYGIAEEHQLHEGDADHHGEGEPVAAHLHEFLAHHGHEPAQGKDAAGHGYLIPLWVIRLMNTSSSLVFTSRHW